ncbi:MAG TPA: PaaI family thioesterase [Methylomirabilota bacterium]|nr:PaaI family thioesterase [Methylomirabilota bacterium]
MNEAHLERLKAVFDRAPVKRTYGMELSFNDRAQAVFDMPYRPDFDHALGGIHGGVFATLMDYAGWFTAATRYKVWLATIDLQIQLLEGVEKAHLRATGELVRAGQRVAVARMEVRTDADKLVAIGTGTFAVTAVPL